MRAASALVVALAIGLPGCNRGTSTQAVKHVAIVTLMTHPALDAVTANLRAELARQGFAEGARVRFTLRNANGDTNAAVGLIREVDRMHPDVLVAITTPVAQAAAHEARSPIVFSAVTDPVGAGVVRSLQSPSPNVTGVSDAWPYQAQLALAREISPGARRLGILYNPGEAASQYGIARIRSIAPALRFELTEIPVSNSGEIVAALRQRIDAVDAVYLSSDNTVVSGMPAALRICLDARKPLYVGDSGTVERGGLAAVSVGYEGVGRATGALVARFLRGERSIPVTVAEGDEVFVNLDTARQIGVQVPSAVRTRARRVFGTAP